MRGEAGGGRSLGIAAEGVVKGGQGKCKGKQQVPPLRS